MSKWSVEKAKTALGKDLYHELRKECKILPKYMMFLAEYTINGFNGTDAYIRIIAKQGFKDRKKAQQHSAVLLGRADIKQALGIVIGFWLNEKKNILERKIIETLFHRAFYDISLFISPTGQPRFDNWEQIPEKYRVCVDGIETRSYGKDALIDRTTIKLANREQAMEKLGKYIAMYKEGEDSNGDKMSAETIERLAGVFNKVAKQGAGK